MEPSAFLAALRRGDEAAWRSYIEEHGRMIHAIAARFGLNASDREDIFQNVCLSAVRHIGDLRDPARLASWTYGIAKRAAIDHIRRSSRALSLDSLTVQPSDPADEARADQELERLEAAALLQDALSRLEPRCRRLLSALYLEQPPREYAAYSESERMPIGSIGPTRARCLEKLRKLLAPVSERPIPTSMEQDAQGVRRKGVGTRGRPPLRPKQKKRDSRARVSEDESEVGT